MKKENCSLFSAPVVVADFMGAANIFTGKARRKSSSELTLETEQGLSLCANCGDIDPEEVAGVCVRPEAIELPLS